jgi:ribonuclease HII
MTLRIAGIDEAGRGPLAGPVVVAAVVFAPGRTPVNGLDDSKALTERKRELLYPRILERALAWKIVFVEADEIDRRNIFQATMHGMREALLGVAHVADCARIDGNRLPKDLPCPAEAWVGGDARDRSIMAASILAKVARDARMRDLHAHYPQYGFDRHKGYPSPLHLDTLRRFGPCPAHRRSFAPVRIALETRPMQDDLPGFAPPA